MQNSISRYHVLFFLLALTLLCAVGADNVYAAETTAAAGAQQPYEPVTHLLQTILDFKLWSIDKHAVTVQTALEALLIIIFGIFISKVISGLIRKRLTASSRINANSALIIYKLLYYFLLVFVLLFALQVLNIPLTAFTFLGGALAIGVGFGTQTIMSNFISGFIIMAERPIRVGDLIQMEDKFATVEEVGVRCTRIRTADNVHILVPNSKFLDQSIINWTLSDKRVRVKITVGVVYGSPVREAERLMLEAADKHPDVKKDPEPYVRFDDFGDNALIFDLYFWVTMLNLLERKRIASDLRFHIDELFRDAGIVIAFPQRDIHLDTLKPLDVRLVGQQSPDAT